MNQLYDFLDCIGDHPLRALLIASLLIATLTVGSSLKIDERRRRTHRRECQELERMFRA